MVSSAHSASTLEFTTPDFSAPLDVEAELRSVPRDATVRGMFFQFVGDRVRDEVGRDAARKNAFESYSMREYMQLLVDAAGALHPNLPLREGLRRVGFSLYTDFERTMIGKAIFAVAGRDFGRICAMASKAYAVSYSPCNLQARVVSEGRALVVMAPVHVFPDCYQVGAFEEAVRYCGGKPTVRLRRVTSGHVELDIRFL